MQVRIPAVYMRGGTSKAVFFHANHLPKKPEVKVRYEDDGLNIEGQCPDL